MILELSCGMKMVGQEDEMSFNTLAQ